MNRTHQLNKIGRNFIIILLSLILIYFLLTIYFTNHFFINTSINGTNVSLKSFEKADHMIQSYVERYNLKLIERNGETEIISAQDIGLSFHSNRNRLKQVQNPFIWISLLFKDKNYYIKDLYSYDMMKFNNYINNLSCFDKVCTKSQNVNFQYNNGYYEIEKEVYGNVINKDIFRKTVISYVLHGKKKLDLNASGCYENPRFTLNSDKTYKTRNLLNQYVATNITYKFGKNYEVLDGKRIYQWLHVDGNLEVHINKVSVMEFVYQLALKYDTFGKNRSFLASTGKMVEVKGGLYGWKINQEAEVKAIIDNIKLGVSIVKEPIFTQTAFSRDDNEIGDTYIEINITKQHLWYYKKGKLFAQGAIVTGNPYNGNATVIGAYTIIYKQKDATLKGPGYEVGVTYWMPFYGNMGLHDARWRSTFGGEIYKTRGTHGCINAPYYLAKRIYDNIEEGIPIVIYKETEDD